MSTDNSYDLYISEDPKVDEKLSLLRSQAIDQARDMKFNIVTQDVDYEWPERKMMTLFSVVDQQSTSQTLLNGQVVNRVKVRFFQKAYWDKEVETSRACAEMIALREIMKYLKRYEAVLN